MSAKYYGYSYTAKREHRSKVLFIIFLIAFVFFSYLLITSYLVNTYRFQFNSMFPEFDNNDVVLTTCFYNRQNTAKRGDLIVVSPIRKDDISFFKKSINSVVSFFTFKLLRPFDFQNSPAGRYSVRRIVGLPGDTIYMENFILYIKPKNGKHFLTEFELAEKDYNIEIKELPADWDTSLPFSGKYPETELKDGQYFVLCDNRIIYDDSRMWGAINGKERIAGRVILKYFPFGELKVYK